jgi:hypothetical protein
MAYSHLKAITTKAKQIRKAHPNMKWTSAIKEASRLLRGKKIGAKRKSAPKKRRRVGAVKKTSARKSAVRRVKEYHAAEGRAMKSLGSISTTKRHLKNQIEEKLAWGMLQQHTAKTKRMKRKIGKKLVNYKRELRSLCCNR